MWLSLIVFGSTFCLLHLIGLLQSSRWVRNGAYEILGPFLFALGPTLVSRELLSYFSGIPGMSSAIVDQEVNYHAAFNFPAVLATVGPERWDELSGCFAALAKDTKFPVRRTLAYSLHELAALLGPSLTEQSLLPALDAFLRDLDEVRYGVLKSFALLMRAITPAKRVAYLEVMWMVQKQQENWRWRMLWAKQLGAFAKLFDAEHTVTDIMPLAFALCKDQVAAVRRTAATAVRTDTHKYSHTSTKAALRETRGCYALCSLVLCVLLCVSSAWSSSGSFPLFLHPEQCVRSLFGLYPRLFCEQYLHGSPVVPAHGGGDGGSGSAGAAGPVPAAHARPGGGQDQQRAPRLRAHRQTHPGERALSALAHRARHRAHSQRGQARGSQTHHTRRRRSTSNQCHHLLHGHARHRESGRSRSRRRRRRDRRVFIEPRQHAAVGCGLGRHSRRTIPPHRFVLSCCSGRCCCFVSGRIFVFFLDFLFLLHLDALFCLPLRQSRRHSPFLVPLPAAVAHFLLQHVLR